MSRFRRVPAKEANRLSGYWGPRAARLRNAFFDTVGGRSTRYADWLTRVRMRAAASKGVPAHR